MNRNIQAKREAAGWPEMSVEELVALREHEDHRAMERIRHRIDSVVKDPATAAMLNLIEPMNEGMGGDLFVIVYTAKDHKLHVLNASGMAA